MTVIDDDVKVWVAGRKLSQDQSDFSLAELGKLARKLFRADPKNLEMFAAKQCVANLPGAGPDHFNYLFKSGNGRYRMFRQGDPIEYTHATAPTMPNVARVPAEHRALFSASRFPEGVRPVDTAPGETTQAPRQTSRQTTAAKPIPAAVSAGPTKTIEVPARGLKVDLSELDQHAPAVIARKTIFDQLFLEFGRLGSKLEANEKETFTIQMEGVAGSVQTLQNLLVKMPSGRAISHKADLVVDLESPGRTLFIDVVEGSLRADDLKAHAFDAIHLHRQPKSPYSMIVFLRTPNGLLQEQAESIGYGYDYFFGVDVSDAKNASKFYALKSQILQWMQGKVKVADRSA